MTILYFTMADTPDGVKRIGNPHSSREVAKSWVPFVRSAHRCRVFIRSIEMPDREDEAAVKEFRRRMDEEFNMEVT